MRMSYSMPSVPLLGTGVTSTKSNKVKIKLLHRLREHYRNIRDGWHGWCPANTRHFPNAVLMLGRRRRWRANIKQHWGNAWMVPSEWHIACLLYH